MSGLPPYGPGDLIEVDVDEDDRDLDLDGRRTSRGPCA